MLTSMTGACTFFNQHKRGVNPQENTNNAETHVSVKSGEVLFGFLKLHLVFVDLSVRFTYADVSDRV